MSVTRTFTVTVQSTGSGNKYFIDGVQQKTLNLIEGKTYEFDQSDSSNNTHPLRFSTTSDGTHSGGDEYTNGVTTNGTPGSSGAYTRITVAASAPTLYYYCTNHSGMGGLANTLTSSITRAYDVTVVSTGSGNKYFIDGVQQDTLYLGETGTYYFDQSDSSNSSHPFRFSTTSDGTHSGGDEYTTGVTTSGTPGQAGAYTQIIVADSAPTLYYYCTNHSGMGGTANTPGGNTWGVLQWNQNSWGSQDDVTISMTGVSATTSVGSVTPFASLGWGGKSWSSNEWGELPDNSVILTGLSVTSSVGILDAYAEQGWGRAAWSSEIWGESYDPVVSLTGVSATSTLGDLAYAASTSGWGRLEWGEADWDAAATTFIPTGLSVTSSVGTPNIENEINTGWGQDGWGVENWGESGVLVSLTGLEMQSATGEDVSWGKQTWGSAITGWGGEYYLPVTDVMGLTGISSTASVGSPTAISDLVLIPDSQSASSAIGSVSVDFSIFVNPTGLSTTSSVGVLSPADVVGLSGLESTSANGLVEITSNPTIVPTGFEMTASTGTLNPSDQVMGLTGLSATVSTGTLNPADVMGLTGVSATVSVSPVGLPVIAWEKATATQTGNWTKNTA